MREFWAGRGLEPAGVVNNAGLLEPIGLIPSIDIAVRLPDGSSKQVPEGSTVGDVAGNEQKARAARARLLGGESFGELARRVSEDEYRVKDGDMGFVHRGRLDREFEDAVFAAPIGRPLLAHSLYGFEVFEVLERQPPSQLTLEQARPIISERLVRDRRAEGLRAWKARLMASAHVEIRDAVLGRTRPADLPDVDMIDGIRLGRRLANGAAR